MDTRALKIKLISCLGWWEKLFRSQWQKRKIWLIGMGGILLVGGLLYLAYLPDGKLRLVFCDVGQGDGIYLDLPDGSDVLIDGGPDRKILSCLGKQMPFWDRRLELVVLSHPQADHLNGLVEVLRRYKVDYFVSSPVRNDTAGYRQLLKEINTRGVIVRNVYAGDKISFQIKRQVSRKTELRILWPSRGFVADKLDNAELAAMVLDRWQPYQEENASNVLGATVRHGDLNDFSIVLELKFGEFEALLGGDADREIQDAILATGRVRPVEVFKVPHHGSPTGILPAYLAAAAPQLAVISVGKNRWGHPANEIIKELTANKIQLWRTDRDGTVKIITDGKQIKVKSDRE